MERNVEELLNRQAAWQKARSASPWGVKLREALLLRRAFLSLRGDTVAHRVGPGEAGVRRKPLTAPG